MPTLVAQILCKRPDAGPFSNTRPIVALNTGEAHAKVGRNLCNCIAQSRTSRARQELIGTLAGALVPALHPTFGEELCGRAVGVGRDLHSLHKDGTEVPVEIGLNPLHTSEGDFVLSSIVDITERKRSDREREALLGQFKVLNTELEQRVQTRTADLSAALQEREVLLQEVHHRVKNNLHVIASLMEMQARLLPPGDGRHALQKAVRGE